MGKKYVIDESTLTDIADVIRDYGRPENAEKKYKPTDMRDGIVGVRDRAGIEGYDAGYIAGLDKGGEEGYKAGYTEGETAGKQTAYDEFSEAFQQNGQRGNYAEAFGGITAFTEEHIRNLKYKVTPTGANGHFGMFCKNRTLKKIEAANIDLSKVTTSQTSSANNEGNNQVFYWTYLEEIEDVGLPAGYYYYTFGLNYRLHTIELIRSKEDTRFGSTFIGDDKLKNIRFEGVIGQNISFSSSPLSVDSLKDVILHLKDYAGGADDSGSSLEYTKTITFKGSAFTSLEAEGETAEYNGTPCTWAELIDNKKWNLTLAS